MTFQEFLEKLRVVAKTQLFYLTETQKWIRTKDSCLCPIESVANTHCAPVIIIAKEDLGLNMTSAIEIIHAADNKPGYEVTRKALLEACGLSS